MISKTQNTTLTPAVHLHNVLRAPLISEKTTRLGEKHRQIVFTVLKKATKNEIKHAVEQLFNVKVDTVNTSLNHPKKIRFKQILGRRKQTKKAYVRLATGFNIDFSNQE